MPIRTRRSPSPDRRSWRARPKAIAREGQAEGEHEGIAGPLDLDPIVLFQHLANDLVVPAKGGPGFGVSQVPDKLRGALHIGEEDGDDPVRELRRRQLLARFLEDARLDHLADLVAELVPPPGHASTLSRLPEPSSAVVTMAGPPE